MSKTIDIVKKYDKVVAYRIFHPSYTFYLPERVRVFNNADSLKDFLQHSNAAVISRKIYSDEMKSIGLEEKASMHDLFEGNTTVIFVKGQK